MKVIVAGSREGVSYREVELAIRDSGWADEIAVVVSGGAVGVDAHGERWADAHGRSVERHPVSETDWRTHGKAAGPMRNRRMAQVADAAIVVWDGKSPGSRNMIYEALKADIPTFVRDTSIAAAVPTPSDTTEGQP